MKFQASYPHQRLYGGRPFAFLLLAVLFVTAMLFILFPQEWFFRLRHMLSRERTAPKKWVITLKDVLPEAGSPEIQATPATPPKKLGYKFGFVDNTAGRDVRVTDIKVGVDYKVTENTAVGIEASRGIHDPSDAAAWDETVKDENAAKAKYKYLF